MCVAFSCYTAQACTHISGHGHGHDHMPVTYVPLDIDMCVKSYVLKVLSLLVELLAFVIVH